MNSQRSIEPNMTSLRTHRRTFLKTTAAASLVGIAPAFARSRNVGSEIRAAVIGFRSRGAGLLEELRSQPGVRVVALADVDRAVLGGKMREFASRGEVVEGYTDARRIFDRRDVDLIVTATPNHWHSLLGIWACQSGKDAYIEKPISHDIYEGRKLVQAARKYGRIVQGGTQCRSSPGLREAAEFVRSGQLGKVKVARGFCYKPRKSIGNVEVGTVPESIEYDLWCGPAPADPPRRAQFHYDWHWFFSTGNGDLGNQGVHQVDLCRWMIGAEGLPQAATSFGGRFGYDDDGETPNTQVSCFEYPQAPLVFEVRGLPKKLAAQGGDWFAGMDDYRGVRVGCVIECENGSLVIPDYNNAVVHDAAGAVVRRFGGDGHHMANFLAAVRSRNAGQLTADCEEGHYSAALCHLANASYRVAAEVETGAAEAGLRNDPIFAEALDRTQSHLQENGIAFESTPIRFGKRLEFDGKTERVTNSDAAEQLLRSQGRGAYSIPSEV
jgi:predicted dehydrogenase